MGEIDRRLDEVARQQHGVFSRIQVLRLGGDHGFIGYRLASGKWIRMGMSVYSLASAPPSWLRALMVAVLSTPSAVVSGRAAAALHQMEGFGECRPEITTPPTANARSPLARICRSEYFNELFVTSVASVPVTTIEEAIFALAHRLAPARLARLLDDALVARKASLEMLMAIHDRHLGGRFKGIRKLRPLIEQRCEDGYVPSATELESLLFAALDDPRIPAYRRRPNLVLPDGTVFQPDGFIDDWRLAVQADGRRWHTRVGDFERDRNLDNLVVAAGIRVLRFTWQTLKNAPAEVRQTVIATGHRTPV